VSDASKLIRFITKNIPILITKTDRLLGKHTMWSPPELRDGWQSLVLKCNSLLYTDKNVALNWTVIWITSTKITSLRLKGASLLYTGIKCSSQLDCVMNYFYKNYQSLGLKGASLPYTGIKCSSKLDCVMNYFNKNYQSLGLKHTSLIYIDIKCNSKLDCYMNYFYKN
jgi:hypothetical protein